MNTEYDRKFEEMKKHIPFLENMITRLEFTSTSSSNPRQAQLDKIRSLRDLLSNKKKRMKMENLLKCEQVLVNLRAKVEQRDTLTRVKTNADSGFSIDAPTLQEKSNLEAVRNKLKNVAKLQENVQDTLPEILPRSEVNDVHTSGTKEPALFQRRPNQNVKEEEEETDIATPSSASKRNYTRVLVSPESSSRRWSPSKASTEKPLFSRRSSRKSPRRHSPSYHKKERRKSKDSQKRKDLNITLNVPEESLNSLNTKDIFSRIINCSDGDVDIDTLRELRNQILGELKNTGANDDISDLILKSYNKNKNKTSKQKEEVEEGELSDSESEAIESIYGSLVVKEPENSTFSSDKELQPRKIQICLVINSDEKNETKLKELPNKEYADSEELVMYEKKDEKIEKKNTDTEQAKAESQKVTKTFVPISQKDKADSDNADDSNVGLKENTADKIKNIGTIFSKNKSITILEDKVVFSKENAASFPRKDTKEGSKSKDNSDDAPEQKSVIKKETNTIVIEDNVPASVAQSVSATLDDVTTSNEPVQFKANFYKPLTDDSTIKIASSNNRGELKTETGDSQVKTPTTISEIENTLEEMEKPSEIPLLHERTIEKKPPDNTLSEIDILQALKKEILSDITMPGSDPETPLLHQPKVMKVASAQEILPKKRISIEKYKEKSVTSTKPYLDQSSYKEEEILKKTSLKLTDKECERFFNIPKISFEDDDDSLDDYDDDDNTSVHSNVYNDLVPKSPDHDESSNIESTPPVIIPVDPVKPIPVNHKVDVDMRTLPILSPTGTINKTSSTDKPKSVKVENQINNSVRPPLVDPRVRNVNPNMSIHSPNPHAGNFDRTPRPNTFGMSSSSSNSMTTSNARTYDMTPTHQSFDVDQPGRKHVYVPALSNFDFREREKSSIKEIGERWSRIDDNRDTSSNPQRENQSSMATHPPLGRADVPNTHAFNRSECPPTPSHPFGRSECPLTPSHPFGRSECPPTPSHPFGRSDCPPTPSHPFGRSDCPPTPSHPFGRSDCPPTPSHPFGRSECPPTPSHPFGRSECPPTPSHPFGRSDCPPTPSHPFGRSECPPTPSHPFGRSERPTTPSHSFERSDCPPTPSHPFGRSDCPPTSSNFFGRSECPPTPSHSFGRSECPPTPNHPFGRSECPPTPSHPFGRSDCPTTPSHPFGRHEGVPSLMNNFNDCPTERTGRKFPKSDYVENQNHPFNRSDSAKNYYGRSDYNKQQYPKDPRLNRKLESEPNPYYDERERGYYKERDRYHWSSNTSQKPYGPDNYKRYDREQDSGRRKNDYYALERSYTKDHDRYDRSSSVRSKVYESNEYGVHSREHRYNSDAINYEDIHLRREKSVGRSIRSEDVLSSDRALSIGRPASRAPGNNTVFVKSNAGRSFTIDTSVNATFQKYIDEAEHCQKMIDNFDARRQRASSVGRFLGRESSVGRSFRRETSVGRSFGRETSVGRTLPQMPKTTYNTKEDKREAFRRASSVGRDIFESKTDKRSFQEIKADFKSYKFASHVFSKKEIEQSAYKTKETEEYGRSRKDIYERQRSEKRRQEPSKSSYSPRKNNRDPRMRKQFENKNDKYGRDSRKSGIVYSNDNIVTGTILKSGYGVKNYKIPKIKRLTEEKEVVAIVENIDGDKKHETDKNKMIDENKDSTKEKRIEKDIRKDKEKPKKIQVEAFVCTTDDKKIESDQSKSRENIERRQTRSSRGNIQGTKEVDISKTKKNKKVIYDSDVDSDVGTKNKDKTKSNVESTSMAKDCKLNVKPLKQVSPKKVKQSNKNLESDDLDSSFGIDELEMFSDNIVTDRVIDNIDALIADLDNDLSASKGDSGHNFTNEISVENMMQNISSPEKDNLTETVNDSVNIMESIDKTSSVNVEKMSMIDEKNESNKFLEDITDGSLTNTDLDNTKEIEEIYLKPTQSDAVHDKEISIDKERSNEPNASVSKSINEPIVSTTEVKDKKVIEDKLSLEERHVDRCSTPDSTINTDDTAFKAINEESLPGNNNEVTSTETIEPKPSSSAKETVSGLDSIGNLLSILQDKSKIKEILNMLGSESSENEKIKKKLEKLSEIVSDEEESCDVPPATTDINTNVDSVIEEKETSVNDLSKDSGSSVTENDSKLEYDDSKTSDNDAHIQETDSDASNDVVKTKKKPGRKGKGIRKAKQKLKKVTSTAIKRVTRATVAETKTKVKKPPRELMKLQEDIKDMFIRDEVLSATGLRMCRLAKLVDEKPGAYKEEITPTETAPVVILEKFKGAGPEKRKRKKPGPKPKAKPLNESSETSDVNRTETPTPLKNKPGPKSKTKNKNDSDPYAFDTESIGEASLEKNSDNNYTSSDSESDSVASSISFGSTELLSNTKKKTKRRPKRGWQTGVIKPKSRKKKSEPTQNEVLQPSSDNLVYEKTAPDFNCFTDRNYCFKKNVFTYSCRLCPFTGTDIVLHYRNQHSHVEIPLSRMAPELAKEAIEQCESINFNAIGKISSDKYVCIFCYKEFGNCKSVLETFFWHIVSMHTGEYKQNCSQCEDINDCPFNLDIPAPPQDSKGQLIGFICKKCNFTQISLENLKTHVIVRHNDEQTAVYTINLAVMTKKSLGALVRRSEAEQAASQAKLRAASYVKELTEKEEDSVKSDSETEGVKTRKSTRKKNMPVTPIKSKLTFEADDNISELSADITSETNIKIERIDSETSSIINNEDCPTSDVINTEKPSDDVADQIINQETEQTAPSNDIFNYPHFKMNQTESGTKEYYCCINGNYHFKTTLLISMKKHVQSKHSETWDGYCYVCKVIVTPQGAHKFRDCLQHYLDNHMDNFPIFEKEISEPIPTEIPSIEPAISTPSLTKPYINVRPLSDLMSRRDTEEPQESNFPIIESVMSLGAPDLPQLSMNAQGQSTEKIFKYEEHQSEVISKKYYLINQSMMTPEVLVKVFKCSGRYCLYATDSTEQALAHATTHQRIGGTDSLNCSYCNFDAAGNAVDLVTHIFKCHGSCNYCCPQCFYRAASSQAVVSHMSKVHKVEPMPNVVLRTTHNKMVLISKQPMLTRDQAVSYYVCGHNDNNEPCKFRTYIPDKFCEHLTLRHSAASAHPCQLCAAEYPNGLELVNHMKIHVLNWYQCTWCVYGADNELQLLSHISSVHPDKQPQAYIRIMTNKDGSGAPRVLPLAILNKHNMPTKDIIPTQVTEYPVREAERSIEMEALIGPFLNQTPETTIENTELPLTSEVPVEIEAPQDVIDIPEETTDVTPEAKPAPETIQLSEPVIQTPVVIPDTIDATITPINTDIVKTETVDKDKGVTSEVVVLDSDEEETQAPQQTVIDLSEGDTSNKKKFKIIPMTQVLTCPNCTLVCKTMGGLKKHTFCCVKDTSSVKCPHCDFVTSLIKLTTHYLVDHTMKHAFECGLCNAVFVTENMVKKHLKNVHKKYFPVVTPKINDGRVVITAGDKSTPSESSKERVLPKRKLSASKIDTTPTKRRYEPQEIDLLPINPILDHLVYCSRCEFSTKVRLNMVRHLQLHAEQQPVPQTAPVNPVPHLESNEKYFDKMTNLASSSTVNRTPDKGRVEHVPNVTLHIPPEAASQYPKYVPERQRLTCGAKGCSYISLDESMLRHHWETLHSGTNDFHCVHCPPYQHLDTSKPLTALRIISHLKMHESSLYACSMCSYYHFKREAAEKHINEVHKNGKLLVVREETAAPAVSPGPQISAPTMDLKPWQCGLCKFKSMLRPEVVEHCSKAHCSKMQFKCAYCPFRTSAIENVNKHQANSHAGKPEEVFYYYYREGTLPDDVDGTARWMKQRQKANCPETEVKTELSPTSSPKPTTPSVPPVDLNLIKKEVDETPLPSAPATMADLCKMFGPLCAPNGIKFKCPLCTVVMAETSEEMQSHLYEELNYRKWGCGLCSYKAFHKAGLVDHMTSEHRRQYDHVLLPTDHNIEKWVTEVLNHQTAIIIKHKENLVQQKIIVENKPGPSKEVTIQKDYTQKEYTQRYSDKDLITAFGGFGTPNHLMYRCPKCDFLSNEEVAMRDHLEMELNKIRWCCSNCPENYQTYHEARFHCRGHDGPSRPVEAIRDPAMRSVWVTTAIQKQTKIIQSIPTSSNTIEPSTREKKTDNDNSLLVIRYEEKVPTPEQVNMKRKRSLQDSDDERLVIDESTAKKKPDISCPSCDYVAANGYLLRIHILNHYNLKPYTCAYCKFGHSTKKMVAKHIQVMHINKVVRVKMTELPPEAMIRDVCYICLVCESSVKHSEVNNHLHNNIPPEFGKLDQVVFKCNICLVLCKDEKTLKEHHGNNHSTEVIDYEKYSLGVDSRKAYTCFYCNIKFNNLKLYKNHHVTTHNNLQFKVTSSNFNFEVNQNPTIKRCARKSTTKLPGSFAKKSTTKLPYSMDAGYSYYGTKPTPLDRYKDVTTLMPFCNKMMPFSLKQMSEHINIEPRVVISDLKKQPVNLSRK